MDQEVIVFDEDACAEFIYNKLISDGLILDIQDIRKIMDLEFQYGVSIGIYQEGAEQAEGRSDDEIS